MVRERKRKNGGSGKESDFRKAKVKVGRRISKNTASKYNNVVDTEIHARSIVVTTKEARNSESYLTSVQDTKETGLKLTKMLPLTEHHNKTTRKAAVVSLKEIILNVGGIKGSIFPKEFMPPIVNTIRKCLLDADKEVRMETVKLLEGICNPNSCYDLSPFLEVVSLQILVGLSSLSAGVRLSSLMALEVIFENEIYMKEIVSLFSFKLSNALSSVLKSTSEMIGSNSKSFEKHCEKCLTVFTSLLQLTKATTKDHSSMPRIIKFDESCVNVYSKTIDSSNFLDNEDLEVFDPIPAFCSCNAILKVCLSRSFIQSLCLVSKVFVILLNIILTEESLLLRLQTSNSKDLSEFKNTVEDFPLKLRNISRYAAASVEINSNICTCYFMLTHKSLVQSDDGPYSAFIADGCKTAKNFEKLVTHSCVELLLEKSSKDVSWAILSKFITLPTEGVTLSQSFAKIIERSMMTICTSDIFSNDNTQNLLASVLKRMLDFGLKTSVVRFLQVQDYKNPKKLSMISSFKEMIESEQKKIEIDESIQFYLEALLTI